MLSIVISKKIFYDDLMKIIDIIFALTFGRVIGFLIGDFLREWDINIGFYWTLVIWLILPIISLVCLWLAFLIGKKLLFVFQGAKFFLVGAVATVVDLKIFEFLFWTRALFFMKNSARPSTFIGALVFIFLILGNPIIAKSISFIVSTFLKYWGNKYWAFQKHEKENMHKEIVQFFIITFVGLLIDVSFFYYFTKIMGPQFTIPIGVWLKLSVIFAALAAALWNFLGYKFLVFKK